MVSIRTSFSCHVLSWNGPVPIGFFLNCFPVACAIICGTMLQYCMVSIPSIGGNGCIRLSWNVVSLIALNGCFGFILLLNTHAPGDASVVSISLEKLYTTSDALSVVVFLFGNSGLLWKYMSGFR